MADEPRQPLLWEAHFYQPGRKARFFLEHMPITFDVRVSRWVNFYHFVQNLSEWNPHFRRAANDYWKAHLEISAGCAGLLSEFAALHRKHPGDPGTNFLGRPFYAGLDDPFAEIGRDIGSDGAETVRRTFAALEPCFNKLWTEKHSVMLEWRRALSEFVNEEDRKEKIRGDLSSFYGTNPRDATVVVELAMTAPGYFSGQANFFDEKTIRLEVSDEPSEKKIVRATGTLGMRPCMRSSNGRLSFQWPKSSPRRRGPVR